MRCLCLYVAYWKSNKTIIFDTRYILSVTLKSGDIKTMIIGGVENLTDKIHA